MQKGIKRLILKGLKRYDLFEEIFGMVLLH